jgi:asparagine synthase (glutamine-hydrolysing)
MLQTRLSIIDLEGGHQPMVDDAFALAANGEIYNFVELRRALEARGRRFLTASDSETIVHAYALDGLEALGSLHGMFASDCMIGVGWAGLARDRLGIKPLYYAAARPPPVRIGLTLLAMARKREPGRARSCSTCRTGSAPGTPA